jgi:hypothetical protein
LQVASYQLPVVSFQPSAICANRSVGAQTLGLGQGLRHAAHNAQRTMHNEIVAEGIKESCEARTATILFPKIINLIFFRENT